MSLNATADKKRVVPSEAIENSFVELSIYPKKINTIQYFSLSLKNFILGIGEISDVLDLYFNS